MIKLIDDLSLLERLSEKEPYFGCLFAAEAISFFDDKEKDDYRFCKPAHIGCE